MCPKPASFGARRLGAGSTFGPPSTVLMVHCIISSIILVMPHTAITFLVKIAIFDVSTILRQTLMRGTLGVAAAVPTDRSQEANLITNHRRLLHFWKTCGAEEPNIGMGQYLSYGQNRNTRKPPARPHHLSEDIEGRVRLIFKGIFNISTEFLGNQEIPASVKLYIQGNLRHVSAESCREFKSAPRLNFISKGIFKGV